MKTTIFILFLLLGSHHARSQTIATVDAMEQRKKGCLEGNEPGRSQLFCIGRYKDQLDSLMQVVYQKLNDRASVSYQQILRKEQADWLEKRMANDAATDTLKKEGLNDAALRIYRYDRRTEFLRDRVKYLIGKL
ncbi:DUF1311 domain-containing protein [Sediminibacterium roseum]|uniref:DUF1311 domain-containing protein n=1 Tax=Sediminibacterium roseum TaxID=1978412 RepID=A0ABW9ZX18_9BACT|nr:lysozyme inhibitor LprI family protein [Sediminibacterium roseum]NCI51706.1 DUF1311 domain-containing protein [Sediminibacterium roseum]